MFENKAILHVDLDAFFASVEVLRDSRLKGKPLIIGGTKGRGVVASCSYEARHFGVRSAMPMKMALNLCPDAIVVRGDMEEYSKQSKIIKEIIAEQAPLFEQASIDEFNLDLTGMDKYFGCWKWSQEMRQKLMKETGLPMSMGLSINKLVSKIGASYSKPNGQYKVDEGHEKAFLAPMAVGKIPGIGKQTDRKLRLMGVRKVKTLSEIPVRLLQREFGKKPGISLHKKSNGVDNSPVVPFHHQKSMSKERTFQMDTIDVRNLKDRLTKMITQLAFELRKKNKLTSTIAVKLRYTDFDTHTQQRRIPFTSNDRELIRHSHELFDKLFQRRILVRLLGVTFSNMVNGNYQIDLFNDTEEEINLLNAMDKIRKRFGAGAVTRASGI